MTQTVGVFGLGIMGGAMAMNLVKNGFAVRGYDPSVPARTRLADHGGIACDSIDAVVDGASVLITSLATVDVFREVVTTLASSPIAGKRLVEVSTLPISAKTWARQVLEASGAVMLDCPVSGTGAQAAQQDLVVFASGDESAYHDIEPVLAGLSRRHMHLGAFGNGSRMKFIANLLVAIHNVSAAEAFTLAGKAGMDLQVVFDALYDSAGTSRMFQVRGPMMVAGAYSPATARVSAFMKDLTVISDFAADQDCPTPLFSTARQLYLAANGTALADEDTAGVCSVLEDLAHVRRGT
jgi:putative dehydrogenase